MTGEWEGPRAEVEALALERIDLRTPLLVVVDDGDSFELVSARESADKRDLAMTILGSEHNMSVGMPRTGFWFFLLLLLGLLLRVPFFPQIRGTVALVNPARLILFSSIRVDVSPYDFILVPLLLDNFDDLP